MIAVLGVSHKTAPVSIRQVFSLDSDEQTQLASILKNAGICQGVFIVSTCNRTEIYCNTAHENEIQLQSSLYACICSFKKISADYSSHLYFYTNSEAAKHLFEVAAGLDSLILGEDQIIGQIKDSFKYCQESKMTDCVINRLLIKAIETGKRVRSETSINKGAVSVSYAAVELCSEIYEDLRKETIMLIGVGQTGELTMQCLMRKGNPTVYMTNRTFSKAEVLASKYGGTPVEFSNFKDYLSKCDVIITATSAKEHLITKEIVEKVAAERNYKPQVYIDLSVPSNVAEKVADIVNVYYYAVDDLQNVVDQNTERRKSSFNHSYAIVNEVLNDFNQWIDSQTLTPVIKNIKSNLDSINKNELDCFYRFKKIDNHELIEQFSQLITDKYTNYFIKKLKEVTVNGKNKEYIKVINELFEYAQND